MPKKECLVGPAVIRFEDNPIEVSVHTASRLIQREAKEVFGGVSDMSSLLVIPTFQQVNCDMTSWGDEQAKEKDGKLVNFMAWARDLCGVLSKAGHWADFTDPASGQAVLGTATSGIYSDVDGLQALGYRTSEVAGGCRLVVHEEYGVNVYPATAFTTAPVDAVLNALKEQGYEGGLNS